MSKDSSNQLWIFDAPTFYDFTKTEEENNHLGDIWFEQSNKPLSSALLELKKIQQQQQLEQQKEEEYDLNINHDQQVNNIQVQVNSSFKYQQQQQFNYTNDVYIHSPTHRIVPNKQRRDMKSEVLRYKEVGEKEEESISTNSTLHSNNTNHNLLNGFIQADNDNNDNNDTQDSSDISSILNGVPSESSSVIIEPPKFDLKVRNTSLQNHDHHPHIMGRKINNHHHYNNDDNDLNKKRKESQKEENHLYIDKPNGNMMDDNIKKRKLIPINDNINEKKGNNNHKDNDINKNDDDHPAEKTLAQVLASVSSFSSMIKKKSHPSSFPPLPLSPLRIKSNKYSSSVASTPPHPSLMSSSSLSLLTSTISSAYRMESALERAKRVIQESHIKSRLWDSSELFYEDNNNNTRRFDLKNSLSSLRIMKQPKKNQRQSILVDRKTSHVTTSSNKSVSSGIGYLDYIDDDNIYNNRDDYDDKMDILSHENDDVEENNIQSSFVSYWSTPYLPINLTKPRSPKFHTDKRSRYYR